MKLIRRTTPYWITADRVHNGLEFYEGEVFLQVAPDGTIMDISFTDPEADVQRYQGWIVPGWVNVHCHLELSHLKGRIPRKTGLPDFLLQVISKRNLIPESGKKEELVSSLQKAMEKGIVAFGDICNSGDTIAVKAHPDLYFHSFVEALGRVPERAEQSFTSAHSVYREFSKLDGNSHQTSIVPHAPYSVSDELYQRIDDFQDESLLSIHSQESGAETDLFQGGKGDFLDFYRQIGIPSEMAVAKGKSSLAWILQQTGDNHPLILVHNTFIGPSDIAAIQNRDAPTYLCLCPNANLYIEDKLPPIDLLADHSLNLCIGTDSLASNDDLCIWSELKTIRQYFPSLSWMQLISWGSYGGARALGISDRYGQIREGTKPGLVRIDPELLSATRIA